MLLFLGVAHAGGLSYHAGAVAVGVERDDLASGATYPDDIRAMRPVGLGVLHAVTYHFNGPNDVVGLDAWIRLGFARPIGFGTDARGTTGELSFYAPINVGTGWFQYVLAWEAGATVVDFEDNKSARWDRLTYFHGPQLKLQGEPLSVYVSPQYAFVMALFTGRPNLRAVAGVSLDSGGTFFANAEVRAEMLRSIGARKVDSTFTSARVGAGFRW